MTVALLLKASFASYSFFAVTRVSPALLWPAHYRI